MEAYLNMHRVKDKIRAEKLIDTGCIACRLLGHGYAPGEIHHIRRFGGKRDNAPFICLCEKHHRTGGKGVAVHAGRKAFAEAIASEERLLEITNELIGE